MFSWFPFFLPIKVRERFHLKEENSKKKHCSLSLTPWFFGYLKGTTIHQCGFHSSLSLLEKVYAEKGLVRVVHVTTRPNPSPYSWRKILRHWPLIKNPENCIAFSCLCSIFSVVKDFQCSELFHLMSISLIFTEEGSGAVSCCD